MYRDFSDRYKDQLLGLVLQVENEKLCNFTDWVGDRWYDFELWIGRLNIRNYLNNVNDYHKKVIDKNNVTQSNINMIFSKVKSVDTSYKNIFSGKKSQLQQWGRYINELSQIVNPVNGKFNIDYISKSMDNSWNTMQNDSLDEILSHSSDFWDNENGLKMLFKLLCGNPYSSFGITRSLVLSLFDNEVSNEDIKNGLNFFAKISKNIGKYGKNEGVTLSSSILGYLSTLCGITDSSGGTGLDAISAMLSLFKASENVESGIYKYFEKNLHPYEFSKLDAKFGKTMFGLKIASDIAGTADSAIGTYNVFVDPNSTVYDKAAESLKAGGGVFKLGGDIYVASQTGTKTLQVISSAGDGSKKVVNQILAEQKLKYATSPEILKKISKANIILDMVNVGVSTISSGIKRFGEVTADGKFDMSDAGSVGVYASLSGLNTVANSLTLGIVDFDSEEVAAELENDAKEFIKSDSWAAQYIRDQDNHVVLRFGVSVGSAAYVLGENVVEGVVDKAKTIGSWISTGWNMAANLF